MKEEDVKSLFQGFDYVNDVHIGINPWDGSCRGYVHCTCSNEYKAREATWKFNNYNYKGYTLYVEYAKPRFYEVAQQLQREYAAKMTGRSAEPAVRTAYAPPPKKPVAVKYTPPQDSSSDSSDSDSSDSDSDAAPAKPAPKAAPKATVKKVVKVVKRPIAMMDDADDPMMAGSTPAAAEPAKKKVKIIKVIKKVPKAKAAEDPPAPEPEPEPEPEPAPAPAPAAEAPAPTKKIVKKIVKKVVKPKAAAAEPEAAPAPSAPAAKGAAVDVSAGVAKAWAEFMKQVEGQGFTEEMIAGCAEPEFDDIVNDLGLTGLKKMGVKTYFKKLKEA